MPQAWITKVEKDAGWLSPDGGKTERAFKHWALAPEMGGRFPPVGSYVQYREVKDPQRGPYVTDVRQLTAPQPAFDGRHRNVYPDVAPPVAPGIARMLDGERVSLNEALQADEAARSVAQPVRKAERPAEPAHQPVETEWEIPAATTVDESRPATATATGESAMTGTIKNIQADKRYGFLHGEDGNDRFFHATACEPSVNFDALQRGETVHFEHEDGPKGARAVRVRATA